MSAETKFRITKKVCACCGERKAASEFHKDRRTPSGLQSRCMRCQNLKHSESYHRRRGSGHRAKWAAIAAEAAASA